MLAGGMAPCCDGLVTSLEAKAAAKWVAAAAVTAAAGLGAAGAKRSGSFMVAAASDAPAGFNAAVPEDGAWLVGLHAAVVGVCCSANWP